MNYIQQPTKEEIDYFTYLSSKYNQRLQLTFQEQNDYAQLKNIVIPYIENLKQQQAQMSQQPQLNYNYGQQQQVVPGQFANPNYIPQGNVGYPQTQQSNYMAGGNMRYDQPHMVSGGYIQPQPNVTSVGGSNRFSSDSNSVKDNNIYNQQNQPVREPIKAPESYVQAAPAEIKGPEPTPNKGSEFKPLILVTQKCMKEVHGNKFEYVVHKRKEGEGKLVNYEQHASIYGNSLVNGAEVRSTEVKDIKFDEDVESFESINQAVTNISLLNGNNEDESKFICTETVLYITGPVLKETTDGTKNMYADLFRRVSDLKTLAKEIKIKMEHKNDFTKNTFRTINDRLTSYVNIMLKGAVSSEWTISSFADDIEELYTGISDQIEDASKANKFYSMLVDVFNGLKKNTDDVSIFEEQVEDTDRIGITFYTERVTMISSLLDEINFELLDLKLTGKNHIKYIDNSITPFLYNAINAVYDHTVYGNRMVILVDKDGFVYRIIKSKISTYTIERIK